MPFAVPMAYVDHIVFSDGVSAADSFANAAQPLSATASNNPRAVLVCNASFIKLMMAPYRPGLSPCFLPLPGLDLGWFGVRCWDFLKMYPPHVSSNCQNGFQVVSVFIVFRFCSKLATGHASRSPELVRVCSNFACLLAARNGGNRLIRGYAQRSFRCADRDCFDRMFDAEWMRLQAHIVDNRCELVD